MIINLIGYEPPSRDDGIPWVQAVIQRGPSSVGPWVTIAQVQLSPIDADPINPQPRNFTFDDADGTQDSWYQIYFQDGASTGG